MFHKPHLLFLLLSIVSITSKAQKGFIKYDNLNLQFEGRIVYKSDAAELSWPGTIVRLSFDGTGVSAILKDADTANYYNVIVDGNHTLKIHTDTTKHAYVLTSNLLLGKHTAELFKRTEWDKKQNLVLWLSTARQGKAACTSCC